MPLIQRFDFSVNWKLFVIDRFLEKVDRSLLHRRHGRGDVAVGRHEHNRQVDVMRDQFFLQLDARLARHLHIKQQTAGHVRALAVEKLPRRSERFH